MYTNIHSALTPHEPGQGSTHLFFKQNLLNGQSEFSTHSGLHPGLLIAFGPTHRLQTANLSPYVSQIELGSHGFGVHGCAVVLSGAIIIAEKTIENKYMSKTVFYNILRTNFSNIFCLYTYVDIYIELRGHPYIRRDTNTKLYDLNINRLHLIHIYYFADKDLCIFD